MKLPREIAGFDSASAMLVALARFLHGRDTPPLGKPQMRLLRPVAAAVTRLPLRVVWRRSAVEPSVRKTPPPTTLLSLTAPFWRG